MSRPTPLHTQVSSHRFFNWDELNNNNDTNEAISYRRRETATYNSDETNRRFVIRSQVFDTSAECLVSRFLAGIVSKHLPTRLRVHVSHLLPNTVGTQVVLSRNALFQGRFFHSSAQTAYALSISSIAIRPQMSTRVTLPSLRIS